MKTIFSIVILIITKLSFAQDFNISMNVSKSDLEINSYEKDSTANALVIYDYGNSYIDSGSFNLIHKTEQKTKILTKDGLDEGNITIKLYKGTRDKERIHRINGATYNLENGKVVKTVLTKDAIFREKNEKFDIVKFVLPNVKVGSIITFSYETESPFIRKYQPWYFQGNNPVLYSEYNTSIPANYEYHIKLVGSIDLHDHKTSIKRDCIQRGTGKAGCSIAKYVMKNIPAYKPEGYTTTALNYVSRLEFELSLVRSFDGTTDKITKTWKDVDKELKADDDFGKQLHKNSLVKNLLPEHIKNKSNTLEKAKAIHKFVLNNYKWNKKHDRYNTKVKQLLKEKVGNAFEINFLLENLLFSEGYNVAPILLSTRKNGFATKLYPIITEFNYVIIKAVIDNKEYLLDATDPYLSFGEIPFKCLNQYGRLIDFKNGSSWVDINPKQLSSITHAVEIKSFKDNMFSGQLQSKYMNYHSHSIKKRFDENSQNYIKSVSESYNDLIVENINVKDYNKDDNFVKQQMDFTLEPEIIGNKIYLNPFIIKLFEENPFKLQERSYPIDFGYKDSFIYSLNFDLGNNLKVIEIPENLNYSLPSNTGKFIFNSEIKNNHLSLYFKVSFNLAVYGPQFYSYLKEFMNKIVESQKNTIIVLEEI